MMGDPEFYVERVHCCVCDGSGKLPKLTFWTKECNVCDGTGQRPILLSRKLTAADRGMVVTSATLGSINYMQRRPQDWLGEMLGF